MFFFKKYLPQKVYNVGDINVPVAYEIIDKPIQYCDIKTCKLKRISEVTKTSKNAQNK
jgi:hypothetical protein